MLHKTLQLGRGVRVEERCSPQNAVLHIQQEVAISGSLEVAAPGWVCCHRCTASLTITLIDVAPHMDNAVQWALHRRVPTKAIFEILQL